MGLGEDAEDAFGSRDTVDLGDVGDPDDTGTDDSAEAAADAAATGSDGGSSSGDGTAADSGGASSGGSSGDGTTADSGGGSSGGSSGDGSAADGSTVKTGFSSGGSKPDPTDPASVAGVNVTGGEARRELAGGATNLDEREALAAQVERLTGGFDARTVGAQLGGKEDVQVNVQDGSVKLRTETGLPLDTTSFAASAQDAPRSAEAAQDAAAAGFAAGGAQPEDAAEGAADLAAAGLTERQGFSRRGDTSDAPTGSVVADDLEEGQLDTAEAAEDLAGAGATLGGTQREDAAEGAADLAARGLTTSQAATAGRQRRVTDDAAERAQDAMASLNAEDIGTDPAEAAQDTAARSARQDEQFGDVDFSAGLGGPQDEVERFTDETLPSAVGSAADAIGLDDARDALTDTDRPAGTPSGFSPAAGGARVTESLFGIGEGVTQLPATGLEAVETTNFLVSPLLSGNTDRATRRAGEVGTAAAAVAAAAAEDARENPRQTAASLFTEAALSAGGGILLGRGARAARRVARTAGARDLNPTDFTRRSVIEANRPDTDAVGEQFPGFTDPSVTADTQASAFRRQSERFTPDEVTEAFGGEPDEGVVDATKALDVEPEGPDGGRGFEAPPSDTDEAGEFETPGTSVGPELSPYFFRESGRTRFSPVPGLPDLGSAPTAAVIRTRLVETDASDADEFRDELLAAEEAGDTAARTLPPDEFDRGEAEAILPPGAAFRQVSDDGLFSRLLGRFGIGADFAVETPAGDKAPVRLFRDADLNDGDSLDDTGPSFLEDDRGETTVSQVNFRDAGGRTVTARELRERRREGSRPVDRPTPGVPNASSTRTDPGRRRNRVDERRDRDPDRRRRSRGPTERETPEPALSGSSGGRSRGRDRDGSTGSIVDAMFGGSSGGGTNSDRGGGSSGRILNFGSSSGGGGGGTGRTTTTPERTTTTTRLDFGGGAGGEPDDRQRDRGFAEEQSRAFLASVGFGQDRLIESDESSPDELPFGR